MKTYIILFFALFAWSSQAQSIAIPDVVFEQFLIDNEIDSDGEINGHISIADALNVTELNLDGNVIGSSITNLSGLEHFTNLESLYVHFIPFSVDISEMNSLRILHLIYCGVTDLNVENNILLEELDLSSEEDLIETYRNDLVEIDLSNNPNIHRVNAVSNDNLQIIRLNNGNNSNIENMHILLTANDVCIQVDDVDAANQDQSPYNSWNIEGGSHQFSDNCTLSTTLFDYADLKVYPNPSSDMIYLDYDNNVFSINKLELYDVKGSEVKSSEEKSFLDIKTLPAGSYLLKIHTSEGTVSRWIAKK